MTSQPALVHPRSEKVVDDDVVLLALVAALDAAGGDLVDAGVGGNHLVPAIEKAMRHSKDKLEVA